VARSHQVAARGWQSKRRAESTRCEALRVSEVRHINQIRWLRTREVNSTRNLELFSFSEDDDVFGCAAGRYFGQAVENTTILMRRRSSIFILRVLWATQETTSKPSIGESRRRGPVWTSPKTPSSSIRSSGLFRFHSFWNERTLSVITSGLTPGP